MIIGIDRCPASRRARLGPAGRAALLCGLSLAFGGCATRQAAPSPATPEAGLSIDPARPRTVSGSLIIVGGGPRPAPVMQRFVELAGGSRARILIMPMATESAEESGPEVAAEMLKLGAAASRSVNLTRVQAMSDTIARIYDGITGIWFLGGDQNRITAVLSGTPAERAIHERYRQGAVVGGTSAGAAIMTTPMISGDEKRPGGARRDTTDAWMTIDRDDVVTVAGLGLLPGAIVDQHFLRRKRHNRLISLVLEHPQLIGAGIDESTAIEVRPDGTWRVLGNSVVVIYDARNGAVTSGTAAVLGARDLRMHVLPPGATYDPRTGKATLP
jgi:cyanophycinase